MLRLCKVSFSSSALEGGKQKHKLSIIEPWAVCASWLPTTLVFKNLKLLDSVFQNGFGSVNGERNDPVRQRGPDTMLYGTGRWPCSEIRSVAIPFL